MGSFQAFQHLTPGFIRRIDNFLLVLCKFAINYVDPGTGRNANP
jgi:hypothetical protein